MENTSHHSHHVEMDQHQQIDNHLSNLIINNTTSNINPSGEEDNLLLEQYERDLDKGLNDHLLDEKEQCAQRLFHSFQHSACTVAQMFKDKTSSKSTTTTTTTSSSTTNTSPQINTWQSFQNSAGAITTLYKDSLEACKANYELGVQIGQQRKLKEIINWLKKKRRRTIRKDELISILIGKQFSYNNNNNNSTNSNSAMSTDSSMMMGGNVFATSGGNQQQQQMMMQSGSSIFMPQSQPSLFANGGLAKSGLSAAAGLQSCPSNMSQLGGAQPDASAAADLATFREALIMHNRSRDVPPPVHHTAHFANNHHHHHYHHHPQCDDLDCFFCEQIATHIEHKRSSSAMNFDMSESPTRKRGRFY